MGVAQRFAVTKNIGAGKIIDGVAEHFLKVWLLMNRLQCCSPIGRAINLSLRSPGLWKSDISNISSCALSFRKDCAWQVVADSGL
jgi:hypothetical protein